MTKLEELLKQAEEARPRHVDIGYPQDMFVRLLSMHNVMVDTIKYLIELEKKQ